ncbi:MAG: Kelch repeat-containing protein [Polyangiales bacterium]
MTRSLCFFVVSSALFGCSSSREAPAPSARETFAHLARFTEFAGHLGRDGALERSPHGLRLASPRNGWQLVGGDTLDLMVSGSRTHLGRADEPDAWIELAAIGDGAVAPEIHGAALFVKGATAATDVVQIVERDRFEEIRVLRSARASASTRYLVTRGPAIASLRVASGRVEAVGHDGRVRLSSAPAFAVDDHGTRRAVTTRLVDDSIEITLDTAGLAYPIAIDPLWTPTPDLANTRYLHGAAPLPDGRAMIAGGWRSTGSGTVVNTTFAYDGTTKTWASLAKMPSPSDSFAMTVLSSGKILVTGGNVSGLPNRGGNVYDPATDTWAYGGNAGGMPYRADVISALSGDRALAVSQPDALLWDLATTTFAAAGTATAPHDGHTATTISGERVLVVGSSTSKVADLWDPTTKTFSAGGTLSVARANHTATLLPSGKVLFAGGTGLSTAEIYDPATKTFAAAGAMSTVRTLHTATVLSGDRVLVTGGQDGSGAALSTTEIYDGATNSWKVAAPMSVPRTHHTATAMPGVRVLVVGGIHDTTTLSTAEVFAAYDKGTKCADSTECTSGFCVDGVCCESACAGQCEACDVAGSEGTCSVVAGAPHGTRTACVAAGTGVCARACDGGDRTQCNFASTSVTCSPASCAAGTATTASTCDGAGNCPMPIKVDCTPYACGDMACKTSCTTDADCGGANVCDKPTGKCIVAVDSKCSPDGLTAIPTDTTKPAVACAPYTCNTSTGKCGSRCVSTSDCVSGNICDLASGACNPVQSATPDDGTGSTDGGGGCSTSDGHGPFGSAALLLLVGVAAFTRRRAV